MRRNDGETMHNNKPNIILIVIDALRADHLSCYGYHKLTCPSLDKFSEECILFKSAFSASPSTVGSIPSILTGLYPSFHGTGVDGNLFILSDEIPTLPETLKKEGYTTIGFNTNPYMAGNHGYNRGYISYFDLFPSEKKIGLFERAWRYAKKKILIYRYHSYFKGIICSKDVNKQIQKCLKNLGKKPFFMWVHYMDVHAPYLPREPYFSYYSSDKPKDQITSFKEHLNKIYAKLYKDPNSITLEERQLIINCYDSEIRYFDHNFKNLLHQLRKYGFLNNTVIILTSDHGEEFWEHGKWGHYMRMYNVNVHVPLLIRHPQLSIKRKIISKQVRTIDIFPTVLDILNIKPRDHLPGISLMPFINDEYNVPEVAVFSEGGGVRGISVNKYIDRLYSLRTSQWNYIKNTTHNIKVLYQLEKDPKELNNIAKKKSMMKIIKEFDFQLNNLLKSATKYKNRVSSVEIDEKLIQRLRALGYME